MKSSRTLGLWGLLRNVAIVAVVGAALLGSQAHAVTILDLINSNGSVTVGDKKFSNFSMFAHGTGDYIADPAGIDVTTTFFGNDPGIEFTGLLFAHPGASMNVNIKFDVEVLDPLKRIHDIGLTFNGAVTDSGQAQVIESALVGIDNVGQAFVHANAKLSDHLLLADPVNGYAKLRIVKDISVLGGPNGTGKISYIGQSFSQIVVPEPATMTVLAAGLGSLVLRRRKKA